MNLARQWGHWLWFLCICRQRTSHMWHLASVSCMMKTRVVRTVIVSDRQINVCLNQCCVFLSVQCLQNCKIILFCAQNWWAWNCHYFISNVIIQLDSQQLQISLRGEKDSFIIFVDLKRNVKFSFFFSCVFDTPNAFQSYFQIDCFFSLLSGKVGSDINIFVIYSFIFLSVVFNNTVRGHNYKVTKGRMIMNWKGCRRL